MCRVHRDTPNICRNASGIVRFWKIMRGEGLLSFCKGCRNTESEGDSAVVGGYAEREVCDNNIKKRSQLAAVTAYLLYWFV